MENYVTRGIHCNHPKVKRIWEFGALKHMPDDTTHIYGVCIIMEDETHYYFESTQIQEAIDKCNEFLNNY